MRRIQSILLFALLAAFFGGIFNAFAQTPIGQYPQRSVRVLNPSSPGGGADVIGRIIRQELSKSMGQTFIVENRPGAANIIATEIASKAAPDGYTLLLGTTGTFVTNPLLYEKLSYSTKQFEPISFSSRCAIYSFCPPKSTS
jgi:tripartite-type tricarboxylate transporter receptor subunit TctC